MCACVRPFPAYYIARRRTIYNLVAYTRHVYNICGRSQMVIIELQISKRGPAVANFVKSVLFRYRNTSVTAWGRPYRCKRTVFTTVCVCVFFCLKKNVNRLFYQKTFYERQYDGESFFPVSFRIYKRAASAFAARNLFTFFRVVSRITFRGAARTGIFTQKTIFLLFCWNSD